MYTKILQQMMMMMLMMVMMIIIIIMSKDSNDCVHTNGCRFDYIFKLVLSYIGTNSNNDKLNVRTRDVSFQTRTTCD